MAFHRTDRDEKPGRDLRIRQMLGHASKHLSLAGRYARRPPPLLHPINSPPLRHDRPLPWQNIPSGPPGGNSYRKPAGTHNGGYRSSSGAQVTTVHGTEVLALY